MRIKWFLTLTVFLLNSYAIAHEQKTKNPFLDTPEKEWGPPVDKGNGVVMYNRKSVVEGAKYKDSGRP